MSALPSLSLGKKLLGRGVSLVVSLLFQLLIDAPFVAEGIEDLSVACAPEKILHGHQHTRARGHSTLDQTVGVFHFDRDSNTGPSHCLGRLESTAITGVRLIAVINFVAVHYHLSI